MVLETPLEGFSRCWRLLFSSGDWLMIPVTPLEPFSLSWRLLRSNFHGVGHLFIRFCCVETFQKQFPWWQRLLWCHFQGFMDYIAGDTFRPISLVLETSSWRWRHFLGIYLLLETSLSFWKHLCSHFHCVRDFLEAIFMVPETPLQTFSQCQI